MPDIFDEVAEDLRAERARQAAKRWGGLALAVAAAVLLGVAGWQGWQWQVRREADAAAARFMAIHAAAARPGADLAAAATGFEAIAREAPAGYRLLAALRAAALKAETGDVAGARAMWDAIAADAGADPLYRDLATLLSVQHGIGGPDAAGLAARLAPLLREDNPWRQPAREAAALLALGRGDLAEARRGFEALAADAGAPPAMRERAQRVVQGMGG